MISFDKVKKAVTTRQAAEYYGIQVNRSGFALCPFHHEKTPSMKIDQRYHCFGCQADGGVIDFTAELFGLSLMDAAEKLAADFGINAAFEGSYSELNPIDKSEKPSKEERFNDCWKLYSEYIHLLKNWKEEYGPKSVNEEYDDRFVETVKQIDQTECCLDELWNADWDEREVIMDNLQEDMERVAMILKKSKNFPMKVNISDGLCTE